MKDIREPAWSVAKCHAVLYTAAVYVDNVAPPSEQTELMALLTRTPTLCELSVETIAEFVEEVQAAHASNNLDRIVNHALDVLPHSDMQSLTIYANCCELVFADQKVHPLESGFLNKIAKRLKVPKSKQKLIERVLDDKNRH